MDNDIEKRVAIIEAKINVLVEALLRAECGDPGDGLVGLGWLVRELYHAEAEVMRGEDGE